MAADYGEVVDASAVHGSTSKAVIVGEIVSVLSVEHYESMLAALLARARWSPFLKELGTAGSVRLLSN